MRKFLLSIYVLFLLASCTKNFEEINTNNNAPEEVSADLLLPNAIKKAVDTYWGINLGSNVGNLISQYYARIQYTDVDRYIYTQSVYSDSWNGLYGAGQEFQLIDSIGKTSENPNYQAVAKIMKDWLFCLLTDIWGDVPYSEALKGDFNLLSPAYDPQKDVYEGVVKDLEAANNMITISGNTIGGDIMFNGNMLKWKKFANSLSLRMLNRIQGKPGLSINVSSEINRILSSPDTYPIVSSNSENIQLVYLSAQPNTNPIYYNRLSRDDDRVSATLVDKLLALSDPRLAIYANVPADGGQYKGVPNGLYVSEANAYGLTKTSKVGDYFVAATAPAVILSYSELLFDLAELASKGESVGKSAKEYYESAVAASFAQYGVTMPSSYLTATAPFSTSSSLKTIMDQKWIALYAEGLESWTEIRRTGYPELTVPTANDNNGVFPTRLPYPSTEESLNYDNFSAALASLGGENNMKMKLWWSK